MHHNNLSTHRALPLWSHEPLEFMAQRTHARVVYRVESGTCVEACPFGVIAINPPWKIARKCTLCYDRLRERLEPACSKACPTDSIQFGAVKELLQRARGRLEQLQKRGEMRAHLYGTGEEFLGGLDSFYLLIDLPAVYGFPQKEDFSKVIY